MITVKGFRQAKGTLADKIVNNLFDEGITIKTSAAPHALADYSDHSLEVYSSSDSADGSNSVEHVIFTTTMSGAGGVGGRVAVNMNISDVALGGWANALRVKVDCGATGYATGLLSAACLEMDMPSGGAGGGTTAILELELTAATGWTGGSPVDIIYFNSSGAGKARMDTYGYLFDIQGLTESAGKLLRVAAPTTAAASLRCKVGSTEYFLPLFSTQN